MRRCAASAGPSAVTAFEDLGIHRLLLQVPDLSELRSFADDVLGKLSRTERDRRSEYLTTLACYLRENSSPQRAARFLHVHPNTVAYRVKRIEEITGLSLDNYRDRLTTQVALEILDALGERGCAMTGFTDVLGQRLLICDGAMGTMLHASGCALDRALPEVNLSDPKLVATIHESYVSAGADIIQTNTFGANRLWLADHGYPDKVDEINQAAVRIAREASKRGNREVFVAGAVSPAVTARQRRQIGAAERIDVITEQVQALAAGGVDLLILETFGYLDELAEAVAAACDVCDVPIVAQATFADDGRTLGGETPHEVASVLGELPIAMLGSNCTTGPQRMLAVVENLVQYSSLPVSAQPNAGQPRRVGQRRFEFSIDGSYFARYLRRFAEAGAALVGGCCGTTPTHIEAAAVGLADLRATGTRAGRAAAHGKGRRHGIRRTPPRASWPPGSPGAVSSSWPRSPPRTTAPSARPRTP